MTFGCQAAAQARPPRQQRSFFVQNCDRWRWVTVLHFLFGNSSIVLRTHMIAEHYRWNGEKASHLKGFGNFLFSKFFGSSIDEITDGRGFEPLVFHIQGIFAVSALFQRAAAAGFRKNWRKIFHKVMGAGLLVFTNQVQRLFVLKKGAADWRYWNWCAPHRVDKQRVKICNYFRWGAFLCQ